ncbi:hypothetical protein CKO28_00210 [Rhodovibrio sodomensis]|uniref:Uncharacterized protein n=1 Tax=Rhodovibrio sodomensis TaxID=1088 RepID=A0ABS1D7R8_9PROT|nr:hypothetical protein [Rhodovibrio sodomensis]MBK1666462.1 hypothetical protein [Rhodovibrio sodomensis]
MSDRQRQLVRAYNTASRTTLRQTLDQLADTARRMDHLGLLSSDWQARELAMKIALTRPMRLYAFIDRVDADMVTADASCAEQVDAGEFDPIAPNTEFLDLILPTLPVAEGETIELRLVQGREDDSRPLVTLRRTAAGSHPAVNGRIELLRLVDWNSVESPEAQDAEAEDAETEDAEETPCNATA